MIIIFCIFLMYLGIHCLFKYEITFTNTGTPGENKKGLEIILFTSNLSNLIGVFALAYFNHNLIVGIMKGNKKSENNKRDLYLSYGIVWLLYLILGVLGMFAVAGLFSEIYDEEKTKHGGKVEIPQTIMDLLIKSNPGLTTVQFVFAVLGMLMIFIQLTSVIPIFCFFCRRMFFNLFYPPEYKLEPWKFHSFNLFFNVSCLVIQVLAIDPSKVIALTGAIGGFVLIYVLPILIHLKCHYWGKTNKIDIISENSYRNSSNKDGKDQLLLKTELNDGENKEVNEGNVYNDKVINDECRDHSDYKKKNIILIYIYYGLIFSFGVVALVFQLL